MKKILKYLLFIPLIPVFLIIFFGIVALPIIISALIVNLFGGKEGDDMVGFIVGAGLYCLMMYALHEEYEWLVNRVSKFFAWFNE